MKPLMRLCAILLLPSTLLSKEAATIVVREIRYDATLSDTEARFAVDVDLEATGPSETTLFDGEVAVLPSKLPSAVRLLREGNQYRVVASRAGGYKLKLPLVAKITRAEPWNRLSFTGPEAAIASVTAQAGGTGTEVQLLAGTLQDTA